MNYRSNRVNDEMRREMTEIVRTVKDPRVNSGLLSITKCDVTPDFKFAKIFYSVLNGDVKETQKGFESASGYIRRELASRLNLRVTPSLTFISDTSIEHGSKIAQILKDLNKE